MKGVLRFAFLFCLLVCMAGSAFAQNRSTGEIRGTVTDASGAVLPGVTVTLNNVDTGEAKDFTTNGDGIFDTVSTPTGHYNITYSKAGFKKLTRGPIRLDVVTITEDATLQVGAVTEEVRVSAEGAPLLDTETGQQATTLETRLMNDLPQIGAGITGNDWANFNAFLPGAGSAPHGRASEGSGPWNSGDAVELNGNLPNYANFLADGATTQLPVSNNNDNMTFETVAEVQVTTSSFSAQYGMGGAVFNQISKGGSNTFHGAAYEYWQNDIMNAASYFSHKVSYLRYDEWGGSIGGPIIKNKLFFYFNRDKIHQFGGASPAYATVPTDNMKAGNFINMPPIYDPTTTTGTLAALTFARTQFAGNQITTIDPVAKKLLPYYPEPNVPGNCSTTFTALCTNNYLWIWPVSNPNLR